MATEIINNGASLKIKIDGDPRDIIKSQIREVTVVRDTIIKIDIGLGALYNVFVDQATVTVPVSTDVNDLKDQILAMLQTATQSGLATEQKQIDELAKITTLQGQVQDLQTKLASVDNKLFFRPCITDENNPNMVYKGYALPGSLVTDAVWAIEKISYTKGVLKSQWAAGNKNLDKIWNNRATLIYS
jgi:hypothetical protein